MFAEKRACRQPFHIANCCVSHEQLLGQVFADEPDVQPETLEVVVYRLRKKLAGTDATLMTLRGLGYLLKAGA